MVDYALITTVTAQARRMGYLFSKEVALKAFILQVFGTQKPFLIVAWYWIIIYSFAANGVGSGQSQTLIHTIRLIISVSTLVANGSSPTLKQS